jgi:hypothetical protein
MAAVPPRCPTCHAAMQGTLVPCWPDPSEDKQVPSCASRWEDPPKATSNVRCRRKYLGRPADNPRRQQADRGGVAVQVLGKTSRIVRSYAFGQRTALCRHHVTGICPEDLSASLSKVASQFAYPCPHGVAVPFATFSLVVPVSSGRRSYS